MNRNLRRSSWRRGVALLALVSSLSGAWLTVVHGSLGDDAACALESGIPPLRHGATLGHDAGALSAQHCYICHWLRSLRSATGDGPPTLAASAPAEFVFLDSITHEAHVALVHLPARSPPA
jgi:hypothetical protein